MIKVRIVLAALTLCAWTQAHAGLFDDEEARKQIAATTAKVDALQRNLEARLADVEAQFKSQGLDLLRDLEGIKSDLARIRGQIEVLTYELTESQKRARDLYVDLDTRIRKMEAGPAASVPTPTSITQPPRRPRWSPTRRATSRRPPPLRRLRKHRLPRSFRSRRRSSARTTSPSTSSSAATTTVPSTASSRS
jgi:hypothetical protein